MVIFTLITLAGPVVATLGYHMEIESVFWIGVGLAVLNLLMNLASGAMKFPIFPLVCMVMAGLLLKPYHFGAAVGLLAWTLIEGLSMIPSHFKKKR